MDDTLARHLAEATEALQRLLEAGRDEIPAFPRAPRPAPVAAPRAPSEAAQRPAPPLPGSHPAPPGRAAGAPTRYAAPFQDPEGLPADLDALSERVAACTNCPLHLTRNRTVFGEGPRERPVVMFVGEGPGAEEDRTGRPFVGAAGHLLDKMIAAMGLRREDCYIANIVKCRPPENATPTPDQTGACLPYLERQIATLQPRFLVALGAPAAMALTGRPEGVARQRGRIQRYGDIPLVVTYHPAALLRNPDYKRPTWIDLQMVMKRLAEPEAT